MGIKAVFFDMGGTLERVWHTPELRLQAIPDLKQLLLSAGIDLGLSDKELLQVISTGYGKYHQWAIDSMVELSPLRVWSEFILADVAIAPGKLSPIAEELMFTLENEFFQREMRSEVPSILKALKEQGYKIGLISNVCSHRLVLANLEKYGIRNYFDPIILSCEYGRRKPDPSIFHYAARLANVPTGACAHVGDRIARDILGARKAGYALAVQIIDDFDHGETDEGAEPDTVIHHFDELLSLLKSSLLQPARKEGGLRALLFDAGDVLYYRPDRGRNLNSFLEQMGVQSMQIPAEQKELLKQQAYQGEITQDSYRESFLKLYGLTDLSQIERGKGMMDIDDNNVAFFAGVPETLKKLKERGFMLGIITDTAMPLHVKLAWFERGGFGELWDSIISSQDLGVQKPDPKIYQAALDQLGLTVNEAVFVGHHPAELDGARAIGMKTIAFNYEKSTRADYFIEKFEDLIQVPYISSAEYEQEGFGK